MAKLITKGLEVLSSFTKPSPERYRVQAYWRHSLASAALKRAVLANSNHARLFWTSRATQHRERALLLNGFAYEMESKFAYSPMIDSRMTRDMREH